jgi:hypothetical protein
VLVGLLGWSVTGGGPFPIRIWLGPVATPTTEPSPSPTPTFAPVVVAPSPYPTPDGVGDEAVAGTETVSGPVSWLPSGLQVGTITTRASMNDPRATGAGTWQVSAELRSGVGPAWGAYRLTSAGGAWEGSCTGALWAGGAAGTRGCWLVGSGAYEGYTYQLDATWSDDGTGDVSGVIYPGTPPAP